MGLEVVVPPPQVVDDLAEVRHVDLDARRHAEEAREGLRAVQTVVELPLAPHQPPQRRAHRRQAAQPALTRVGGEGDAHVERVEEAQEGAPVFVVVVVIGCGSLIGRGRGVVVVLQNRREVAERHVVGLHRVAGLLQLLPHRRHEQHQRRRAPRGSSAIFASSAVTHARRLSHIAPFWRMLARPGVRAGEDPKGVAAADTARAPPIAGESAPEPPPPSAARAVVAPSAASVCAS